MRKFFSALIITLFLILLVAFSIGFIAVRFHQDKLLNQVKLELAKTIRGETGFNGASVGFLSTFPQLSVRLDRFYIKNQPSFKGKNLQPGLGDTLISVNSLYLELNTIELLQGKYVFQSASLENGALALYHEPDGSDNYFFLFEDSTSNDGSSSIDLKKIKLTNLAFYFRQAASEIELQASIQEASISGKIESVNSNLESEGKMLVHSLLMEKEEYLHEAGITYSTGILDSPKELILKPLIIRATDAEFTGELQYGYETGIVNFTSESKAFNLAPGLAIMPVFKAMLPDSLEVDGLMNVQLAYTADLNSDAPGKIEAAMQLNKASFGYRPAGLQLKDARLQAIYRSDASLSDRLDDIQFTGTPDQGGTIQFDGYIHNFDTATIKGNLQFDIPDKQLAAWMGPGIELAGGSNLSGKVLVQGHRINFEESFELLVEKLNLGGEISLSNFKLNTSGYFVEIPKSVCMISPEEIHAGLIPVKINNQALTISQLKLLNWAALAEGKMAKLTGVIESSFLDLAELDPTMETDKKDKTAIHLPTNLTADISVHVASIKRDRFEGKDITGRILLSPGNVKLQDAGIKAVNGRMRLNAELSQNEKLELRLNSLIELQEIDMHELLFAFRDFNQQYIVNSDIMGDVTGKVSLQIKADSLFGFMNKDITGTCDFQVMNGELHDMKSLQKVSEYTKIKELQSISFSKIEGNASLQNGVLNLNKSLIRSNVADIDIHGTHELGKTLDYRFDLLLSLFLSSSQTEGEKGQGGRTKLYLKLAGSEEDYSVSYDLSRRKEVAVDRMKQEKQELKDAFSKEFGKKNEQKQDSLKDKKKKTTVIWE